MSEDNNNAAPQERLLTVAEFAREIGKTERQVYRYIKSQRIHSLAPEETGQAGVRIASSEVERFLADGGSASVSWRVRPATAGVGSAFESFENSAEGLSEGPADLDSNEDDDGTPLSIPEPITVPLERHEAAVMRLGYLQSQYEQTQRLLTEGNSKQNELNEKIAALQARVEEDREKLSQVAELERELEQYRERSAALQKEEEAHKSQLEAAQEEALRFRIKAEVEADSRAEVESRLRHLTVRLEEAERRAALPWWKKLFG
ncbi:hypothetical protein IJT17_02200 [bacterium]|nr:hypothetical protein [bacterium]